MPRFVSIFFVLWLCVPCPSIVAAAQGRFTPEEQACRIGGELVAAIGIARDVHTPLTDVIRNLRHVVPGRYKGLAQVHRMPVITEMFVDLAKTIYFAPELSPHILRSGFETGCLNPDKVHQQWLRQD